MQLEENRGQNTRVSLIWSRGPNPKRLLRWQAYVISLICSVSFGGRPLRTSLLNLPTSPSTSCSCADSVYCSRKQTTKRKKLLIENHHIRSAVCTFAHECPSCVNCKFFSLGSTPKCVFLLLSLIKFLSQSCTTLSCLKMIAFPFDWRIVLSIQTHYHFPHWNNFKRNANITNLACLDLLLGMDVKGIIQNTD